MTTVRPPVPSTKQAAYRAAYRGTAAAIRNLAGGYASPKVSGLTPASLKIYKQVRDALVRQGSGYATHTQPAPNNEATQYLRARGSRVNLGNNTENRMEKLNNPVMAGIVDAFADKDARSHLGNPPAPRKV